MGFYGFLNISNEKTISIDNEQSLNVGNALAAFLIIYTGVDLQGEESPEYQWFARLESQTHINLRLLARIIYNGEWNYKPDDYDKYVADWRSKELMSEEEFKKVSDIEKMWTPIDNVIQVVEEFNRLLPGMGEDTHWYTKADTLPAFRALLVI